MPKKSRKESQSGAADPWSAEKIVQAASSTGKSFEVQTAVEFFKRHWLPIIGTYYHDVTTEAAREVDVLAKRHGTIDAGDAEVRYSVRAYVSCKAYPSECRPVLYSHAHDVTGVSYHPILPCNLGGFGRGKFNFDPWDALPFNPPFLHRQVTGFDVYEEQGNGTLKAIGDRQMKGGRDSLYPALDSAIKAAVYWYEVERGYGTQAPEVVVHVPILVSKKDWIHISLDNDTPAVISEPIPPFKTVLYPIKGRGSEPEAVTCMLCSSSSLPQMIGYLDSLYQGLREFLERCTEAHKRQSRRKES